MKRYMLPIVAFCALLSCKKEHTDTQQLENSKQVLTKIIKTADYGGGTLSVDYAYNSAGKLIKEGNKTYERDNQQRIVRILEPGTSTNENDIQVHYNQKNPNLVDYTFCAMTKIDATDSVVYLHDNNGRLIKTMSYTTWFSDRDVPPIAFLSEYETFSYDPKGNLIQVNIYVREYDGRETLSGEYYFINYDKGINPLYTGDEVRAIDFSCGSLFISYYGIINNSMNNFTSINNYYTKLYEYRADGRPRSCLVQQNGNNIFRLVYEYK